MAAARFRIRVADDQESVAVELGPIEGPSAPVTLDLEKLTKVINVLGHARSKMLAGQQIEPLDGKTVDTVVNPMWYIQVAKIDGSLLAFNHPAYGPMAFAIPRDDIAKIVRILTSHLALPLCPPDKQS